MGSGDLTLLVAVAVAEVRVEALIKPLATNELSLNVPLDLEETMAPNSHSLHLALPWIQIQLCGEAYLV